MNTTVKVTAAILLSLSVGVACSDDKDTPPGNNNNNNNTAAPSITSVAITPNPVVVELNNSQQLTVTGTFDDDTTADVTSEALFASSNTAVVSVNTDGLVTATTTGTATISATVEGASSTVLVTVPTPRLVSLALTPSPLTLSSTGSQQLTVTGVFSDGSTEELTTTATFASTNIAVATVDAGGRVSAVAAGTATVTATIETIDAIVLVTVNPPALTSITLAPNPIALDLTEEQQLTVTGTFDDESTADVTASASFASSDTAIATVNDAGRVTAVSDGMATITATVDDLSATVVVTVDPVTLVSIEISPSPVTLDASGSQQLTVTGTFDDESTADLTSSAAFSSANAAVAAVNATGLVTAVDEGTTTVSATVNDVSATVTVTVNPPQLVSVAITPDPLSLQVNGAVQLTVTGTFEDDSTEDLTDSAVYTSANTAVAQINAAGRVTGIGFGATTITASVNQVSDTVSVTVDPPLTALAISPNVFALAPEETEQLTVTGTFQDGSTLDVTSQVTFADGAPIYTVSPTGVLTALSAGTATVTCTLDGQAAAAALAVIPPNTAVALLPKPVSIRVDGEQRLSVIATFEDGSTSNVREWTTFSSDNPDIATVDELGFVAGVAEGTTRVVGTVNGLSDSTDVTVGPPPPPLLSIRVAPAQFELVPGESRQLTVFGTFETGPVVDVTADATFTADTATVTVDAAGLVTANVQGFASVTATVDDQVDTAEVRVRLPEPIPLPMVVDDAFPARVSVGPSGVASHTEDNECPKRVGGEAGDCHRLIWDASQPFTGMYWSLGSDVDNLEGQLVEAGAVEVAFYAWTATGTTSVQFGAGLPGVDVGADLRTIDLSVDPTRYTVTFETLLDYFRVYGAFTFLAEQDQTDGFTIFVDDIVWNPVLPESSTAD